MTGFLFHRGDQKAFGLFGGEAGNAFQGFHLALLQALYFLQGIVGLFQLLVQFFLFFLDVFVFAVQLFFLLLDAAFLLLDVAAALFQLSVRFGADLEHFLAGFHHSLALFGFGGFNGVVEDASGFVLGAADLFFSDFFSV